MYDYFDSLERRGGGRGELNRPSEATGEQTLYSKLLLEGMFTALT